MFFRVRYKRTTYRVSFKGFVLIIWLQIQLLFKRNWRRLRKIFFPCLPTLWLLPVWALCIWLFSCLFNEPFVDLLYQAKFSIVTSVILVCASRVRDSVVKSITNIRTQWNLYTDLLIDSEWLIQRYLDSHYLLKEPEMGNYWFYTLNRFYKLRESICRLKSVGQCDCSKFSDEFKSIEVCLRQIERAHKEQQLLMVDDIEEPIAKYRELYKEIFDRKKASAQKYLELFDQLYNIVRCVRFPWANDLDTHRRIAKKIYDDNGGDSVGHDVLLLVDPDYCTEYPSDKNRTAQKVVRGALRNVRKRLRYAAKTLRQTFGISRYEDVDY